MVDGGRSGPTPGVLHLVSSRLGRYYILCRYYIQCLYRYYYYILCFTRLLLHLVPLLYTNHYIQGTLRYPALVASLVLCGLGWCSVGLAVLCGVLCVSRCARSTYNQVTITVYLLHIVGNRVLNYYILYPTTSCIYLYTLILYLVITISRTFTCSPTQDAVVLYIVVACMSTHYILCTISCTYIFLYHYILYHYILYLSACSATTSRTSYILWVRCGIVLYLVPHNYSGFPCLM